MFDFSRRKATESTESRDVDMEPRQDAETSDEGAADSEDALEATEGYYRAVESENHTEICPLRADRDAKKQYDSTRTESLRGSIVHGCSAARAHACCGPAPRAAGQPWV